MGRFLVAPLLVLSLVVMASATATGYGYNYKVTKPMVEKPKPLVEKPKPHGEPKLFDTIFGVQGFVYCKHDSKSLPLQGAYVRVTCLAESKEGYETAPFSVLSKATNKKGYFFASLCPSLLAKEKKLKDCKVFLESSPTKACNVPTNENKGVSGCPLTSFTLVENNKMKLYSVPKPLYYTHGHGYATPTTPKGY